jgi:hypothetical protein
MGGLGNQLFQLAAAVNLAEETGRKVRLDTSVYSRELRRDPRNLELKTERIPISLVRVNPLIARVLSRLPSPIALHEVQGRDLTLKTASLYATGYFQKLSIATNSLEKMRPYLKGHLGDNDSGHDEFVAVHCRLGDYLRSQTRSVHGVTDPRWSINQGIRLASELGVSTIRIFTDSPLLISELLPKAEHLEIDLDPSEKAWEVLISASRAKGLVISNSSLSWWAAFVAQRVRCRESLVVMPYPWMAYPSSLDHDLRDPKWRMKPREIL